MNCFRPVSNQFLHYTIGIYQWRFTKKGDTTNVATQLSAVNAVVTQYAETINAGVADPESTLKALWADLDSAGYQEVIDENQKQLNEYLESKNK